MPLRCSDILKVPPTYPLFHLTEGGDGCCVGESRGQWKHLEDGGNPFPPERKGVNQIGERLEWVEGNVFMCLGKSLVVSQPTLRKFSS